MTVPFGRIKLGLRWLAAFSCLVLTVHEGHELVHAMVGRILCGEWPTRDFNSWRFAGTCASWWPTAAGPLFSYALMLAGSVIARRVAAFSTVGIALLFAANPFARTFTAAMGGGDEMVVAQRLIGASDRPLSLRLFTLAVVTTICGSALVVAWRSMGRVARRGLWFPLALLWPMVLTGVGLFLIGNRLLRQGLLVEPIVAGAPLLVLLVSGAAVILTGMTLRWLRADTLEHQAA
jgi:hypothetical protein